MWRTILTDAGLFFAIAHRNFVSIYDILANKWTSHKVFDDFVRSLEIIENRKLKQVTKDLKSLSSIHQMKQNGVLILAVQEGFNGIHECIIENGKIKEIRQTQDQPKFSGEMIRTVCQYNDINTDH